MRLEKRVVVCLDFIIDSSEALMFTKGGKAILKLNTQDVDDYSGDDVKPSLITLISDATEVQISFSLDSSQQSRFDYINECAQKHKESKPTAQDYEGAAQRMKERSKIMVKPTSSEESSDPSLKQDS